MAGATFQTILAFDRRQYNLFVFIGESNSGGYALNAELTGGEAAARSAVQILNNTSLAFEDLDIGTNNLIDHAGLTANATHGWDNQLANATVAGRLDRDTAYLVKCGQGGSRIHEWAVGHGSGYWTTALARIAAAIVAMHAAGLTPRPVICLTLGHNDTTGFSTYGTGNPAATSDWAQWRTDVEDFVARIRTAVGDATAPVVYPLFQAPMTVRGSANTQILAMDAADQFFAAVTSTDCTIRDSQHWDRDGFRLLFERMLDAVYTIMGRTIVSTPLVLPDGGLYVGDQSVTVTDTDSSLERRYSTDLSDPRIGTVYTGALTVTPPGSFSAVAVARGRPTSAIASESYSVADPIIFNRTAGTSFATDAIYSVVNRLKAAQFAVPPSATPTKVKVTVRGSVGAISIGHAAASGDAYDADALTPITFGGSPGVTQANGATTVSDEIAWVWDKTTDIIISIHFPLSTNSQYGSPGGSVCDTYFAVTAVDQTATANKSGHTIGSGVFYSSEKVELVY